MQPTDNLQARQLGSLALSRGWLSADSLWVVFERVSQQKSLSAVFAGFLSPQQLESLLSEISSPQESTQVIRYEGTGSLRTQEELVKEPSPPIKETSASLRASSSGRYLAARPSAPQTGGGRPVSKTPSPSSSYPSMKAMRAVVPPPPPPAPTPPPEVTSGKTQEVPMIIPQGKTIEMPASAFAERYVFLEVLGQGAEGRVISVNDKAIGRTVALKTLLDSSADEQSRKRFVNESQLTARLEHPSIIPVYDIGTLPDDLPYYTMRVVKHRSLKEILEDPAQRASWSFARLCGVFVQVCRAIGYAHSRGIVHRDLKPANILLGDYGEVYVADWGIARVLGDASVEDTSSQDNEAATRVENEEGLVIGSPGYMSPEQVRSDWSNLDARSDLFGVGVMLYELLTGQRPFQGKTNRAVLLATLGQEPVRPRDLVPSCPLVLEDLCLKLLAKDKKDRPASAEIVAAEIEAFLEGAKERARKKEEAARFANQAAEPAAEYVELGRERDRLLRDARLLLRDIKAFDTIEKKRPAWNLQDQARAAEAEQARALASAIELYTQALGHDPQCQEARRGLAQLYWMRVCEAEGKRDEPSRIYYESLVRDFDDGRYAAFLSADARLSIRTNPSGAQVFAVRYIERDRRLVPAEETYLGEAPLRELRIGPGNYTLLLRLPGYREVRYPILARRGQHHRAQINLYSDREIGHDFIYIPGGGCLLGGDPEALNSLPQQEAEIGDFAISRFPVTMDEYAAFINDLGRTDQKLAEKRLPHDEADFFFRFENGRWLPDYELYVEGEGRQFCAPQMLGASPVMGINWFDAVSYARWKGNRDGVFYRLPLDLEYEKAARGTDGRLFPWGDHFDPTFCKMTDSRPGYRQPEPIINFPLDESPYGVRHMAGLIRAWIADISGELDIAAALQEREPTDNVQRDQTGMRLVRGGAWSSLAHMCRAASRARFFAFTRDTGVGIRLAKPLSPPIEE